MKNKEIVCVMAHATNEEKKSLLKRCLMTIKSYGYDTVVCSHINVPSEIFEESDYFVSSKSNPIITHDEYETIGGGIYYWQDYSQYYLNKKVDFNHGLTHLRLMLQAAAISAQEGYDVIHLVNYDYIVNDISVLKDAADTLDTKEAHFFSWHDQNSIITGMMSFRIESLLRNYGHIREKKDYCAYGISIFEDLFLHIVRLNGITHHIEERSKLNGRVEQDLINVTDAYGLYDCEGSKIRIVPCRTESDEYYLLMAVEQELNENYLNIYYRGRYYSIKAVGTQLIELSFDMIEHGFTATLSKGQVNLKIDSKSNISHCVVKDTSVVKKLI
jgi:hypothetical protein